MENTPSKPPSQCQEAGGGRKLKREGAIADINALYEKVTPATGSGNSDQTGMMDIDGR